MAFVSFMRLSAFISSSLFAKHAMYRTLIPVLANDLLSKILEMISIN